MAEPVVSVLITCYNRQLYLADCIESVLQQTINEIEIIIIDDCSTDNSYEIAEEYSRKDSRIRLYRNEKNIGQFANRNKAISLATGRYIKFLDSDDLFYPFSLQIMTEAMLTYPEAVAGFPVSVQDGHSKLPKVKTSYNSVLDHFNGHGHLSHGPTAVIFKRAALNNIFFEDSFGILADTLFNLKAACTGSSVFFQKDLYYWRAHKGQITEGQKQILKMILERYHILLASLNYQYLPLSKQELNSILNRFNRLYFSHALRFLLKGEFYAFFQILKILKRKIK